MTLWDFLKDGYYIYYRSYDEASDCLRECAELGIRWGNGQKALDYQPIRSQGCLVMNAENGRLYVRSSLHHSRTVCYIDIPAKNNIGCPAFTY